MLVRRLRGWRWWNRPGEGQEQATKAHQANGAPCVAQTGRMNFGKALTYLKREEATEESEWNYDSTPRMNKAYMNMAPTRLRLWVPDGFGLWPGMLADLSEQLRSWRRVSERRTRGDDQEWRHCHVRSHTKTCGAIVRTITGLTEAEVSGDAVLHSWDLVRSMKRCWAEKRE